MALLKRTTTLWLLRSLAALTLAVAAVVGVTGQALAHDDNDGNEVVTYGPTACTAIIYQLMGRPHASNTRPKWMME